MKTPTSLLPLFLCAFSALSLFAGPPLVVTGWDSPNATQFRQHLAEFEKLGLFEGTNIDPTRRAGAAAEIPMRRERQTDRGRLEDEQDAREMRPLRKPR